MNIIARLTLALLIVLALGCSQEKPAPVQPAPADSEQVSPAVKQELDANSVDDLGNLTDLQTQALFAVEPTVFDTNFDVYAVTFLWGHLANTHPNIESITNWTGGVSINGVAVIKPVALIKFEPGQDKLIPTDVPSAVAWESFTSGDFDGIAMLVFVDRRIVYAVAPQLTFHTPPFTKSWYLDELANLYGLFPVDQINAVAVKAVRLKRVVCGFGTLFGKWVRTSDDTAFFDSGVFDGALHHNNGTAYGLVSGRWWDEPNDNLPGGAFEGDISDVSSDVIIAGVKGHWFYDDYRMCPTCGEGHGRMAGLILSTSGELIGKILGEFSAMEIPTPRLYDLTGKWYERCSPWKPADPNK